MLGAQSWAQYSRGKSRVGETPPLTRWPCFFWWSLALGIIPPRRLWKVSSSIATFFFFFPQNNLWFLRLQWVMSCNWMCHIQLQYDEKQHNKKWQDLTWQVKMKCCSGKYQFSAIWYVMFFKKNNLTVWFSYNNHSSWHTELLGLQCFMFSDTPIVIIFWNPVERYIFGSINTCILTKINHQCESKTQMLIVMFTVKLGK